MALTGSLRTILRPANLPREVWLYGSDPAAPPDPSDHPKRVPDDVVHALCILPAPDGSPFVWVVAGGLFGWMSSLRLDPELSAK